MPDDAVAVVGARAVPIAGYDRLIRDAKRQYAQRRKPFPQPGTEAYAKVRDTTVSYLVHTAEIEQEAAGMGVYVTPGRGDAGAERPEGVAVPRRRAGVHRRA